MPLLLFFNVAFCKRLLPQTAFSVKSQRIFLKRVFPATLTAKKPIFCKENHACCGRHCKCPCALPHDIAEKKLRHNAMKLCTQNKRTKRLFYRKIKKEEKFSLFFCFYWKFCTAPLFYISICSNGLKVFLQFRPVVRFCKFICNAQTVT